MLPALNLQLGMDVGMDVGTKRTAYEALIEPYIQYLNRQFSDRDQGKVQLYRVFYGLKFRAFMYVGPESRNLNNKSREYSFFNETGVKGTTFTTDKPGRLIIVHVTGGDITKFQPELLHISKAGKP